MGNEKQRINGDECLALMIKKESEHLPASDYFKRLRNAHFDFGPLYAYLSIN